MQESTTFCDASEYALVLMLFGLPVVTLVGLVISEVMMGKVF